ncbi:MAG TPA: sterol desaturase family protein [Thermoanaerobaculia bacterium]|nr:sterol desaturase family protein [Thermoanaerobaculia bacterium]
MNDITAIATWLTLGMIPTFLLLDLAYRARRYQTPRYWRVRALAVTLFVFALSFVIPMFWSWAIGDRTLFNLAPLGTWGGAAVAVLVYQLGHYWYHRLVHRSDFLFRWVHQMHHSVEGVDAFGAYYLSPLDAISFGSIASLVFFPILGVSMEAGVVGNLFLTFAAVFQHANIRTPRWLGYIIQRPESHGVHHERGVHRYNYCDLPVIDMLFGTYRNPEAFDAKCGYWDGASSEIWAMLTGKDVTKAA